MTSGDGQNIGYDCGLPGKRTLLLGAYEVGRYFYRKGIPVDAPHLKGTGISPRATTSAEFHMRELASLLYYSIEGYGRMRMRGKKVTAMDVDEMVQRWHRAVVGLAIAHDKDEADRHEASIEECLSPLLIAPIKQIREFAPKLLASLKADPKVPFMVWRGYEVWFDTIFAKASDEGIVELKTHLAGEIAQLVETDVKEQLPEAIIRALQWRSAETLAQVKQVVEEEKAKGNKVRLRGRESCLFLEAGGTDAAPAVCVQI